MSRPGRVTASGSTVTTNPPAPPTSQPGSLEERLATIERLISAQLRQTSAPASLGAPQPPAIASGSTASHPGKRISYLLTKLGCY